MQQQQIEKQSSTNESISVTFLVVGGGIAGVTCAEMLSICCPNERILLLTESSVIKTVANLEPIARYLHKFDVQERTAAVGSGEGSGFKIASCVQTIVDQMQRIDVKQKRVYTVNKRIIEYRMLCLCTGGMPRIIDPTNPRVLGIRDTDSVLELQRQLQHSKRIVLVGNGGIASELAYELHDVEVHWVIKDKHITSTFVDPGAAHFFLQSRQKQQENDNDTTEPQPSPVKRMRYCEQLPGAAEETSESNKRGAALGPDWHKNFSLTGSQVSGEVNAPIIHYATQIKHITNTPEALEVTLANDERITCDFIVSATGVDPRHDFICDETFKMAADGGIEVNEMMQTNLPEIYAAGDVCTAAWEAAPHWFQMRLWTQARQMGAMAGRSMAAALKGEEIYQDFCFELFGHVTQLFGFQVVLLGRYNGQQLGTDYELLLRTTPGKEYIKFVLQHGRLRGAILIGNTELAETCENLILNGIDLTSFGDDILNPDIDIEDYFD